MLMHLSLTGADAMPVEVELHVGMVRQQRHGHAAVWELLRDHQRRQPHAERVVMGAGLPDRDLFRPPGLPRPHRQGLAGHVLHHTTA